jgi:hypothetical protein
MPTEKPPTPQIENVTPPDGLPSVYANNIAMGNTVFDVRMIFGEVADSNATKITINQRVQVTMSWPQAKIFWEFLGRHIRAFEEKNGPIILPALTGQVSVEGLIDTKKSAG